MKDERLSLRKRPILLTTRHSESLCIRRYKTKYPNDIQPVAAANASELQPRLPFKVVAQGCKVLLNRMRKECRASYIAQLPQHTKSGFICFLLLGLSQFVHIWDEKGLHSHIVQDFKDEFRLHYLLEGPPPEGTEEEEGTGGVSEPE